MNEGLPLGENRKEGKEHSMGSGLSTVAHVPLFIWTTYGEVERNSKGVGTYTWGELERLKENHKMHVPGNQETPVH